jgi:hypothetical protein
MATKHKCGKRVCPVGTRYVKTTCKGTIKGCYKTKAAAKRARGTKRNGMRVRKYTHHKK